MYEYYCVSLKIAVVNICCPLCVVIIYMLVCCPLHVVLLSSNCFVVLYILFCPFHVVLCSWFCCPRYIVLLSCMCCYVVLYEWFCCPLYVSTTLHWARTGVFPAEDNTKLSSYRNSRAVTVPEYSLVQRQAGWWVEKRQS